MNYIMGRHADTCGSSARRRYFVEDISSNKMIKVQRSKIFRKMFFTKKTPNTVLSI